MDFAPQERFLFRNFTATAVILNTIYIYGPEGFVYNLFRWIKLPAENSTCYTSQQGYFMQLKLKNGLHQKYQKHSIYN